MDAGVAVIGENSDAFPTIPPAGQCDDDPRIEAGANEAPSLEKRLGLIGTFAATASGGAALLGLLWTVGYFMNLPSGMPDPKSLPISTLAPFIAVPAVFMSIAFAALFGAPGLIFQSVSGRERTKDRQWESDISWLYMGLCVCSTVVSLIDWFARPKPSPWILLIIPAVGFLCGLIVSVAKNVRARLARGFVYPAIFASVMWWFTYFIADGVARVLLVNHRSDVQWVILAVICLIGLLSVSAMASIAASHANYPVASIVALAAVLMVAFVAPRDFFAMPYRSLHLADFRVDVWADPGERAGIQQASAVCGDGVKDEKRGWYRLQVITSLGDSYIVHCGAGENWMSIPKESHWIVGDRHSVAT